MKRALFLALLLYGSPALAGDWRFLNIGQTGEIHSVSFIDVGSVRRTSSVVRYWRDTRDDGNIGNNVYPTNRLVELIEVDCSERKYRELSSKAFEGDNFTLDSKPDPTWQFAVPDTKMDDEISRVCHGRWGDVPLDRDKAASAVLEGMERRQPK